MLQLHDFQKQCVGGVYQKVRSGIRDTVLVASTGSGKTVMGGKIIHDALSKGRNVGFFVTINCLIEQAIEDFAAVGIDKYGIVCADYKERPDEPLQIFSLQTLAKRPEWLARHYHVSIWDECHTSRWFGVSDQIQYTHGIGLTATPFRLSKKQGFGDKFQAAVLAPPMTELTDMGFLCPVRYKGLQAPDRGQIKIANTGDFDEASASKICNTPEAIKAALDGWESLANTLQTIVFCVDVEHCRSVLQAFRDRGYRSEMVTGATPSGRKDPKPGTRAHIFGQFKAKEIQVLVSCKALSTGFNVKNIECGLDLAPTQSLANHMQKVGRIARTFDGKLSALWLDAAGNCTDPKLGFPEQISAALTEENVLSYGQESLGQAPIKKCPGCDELILAAARICPNCGHEFEFEESDREVAVGQFVDLMNPAIVRQGGEAEHVDYYRYLIKRRWDKGECPSRAYADYLKQGFDKFPKPFGGETRHRWGRGAIFAGDVSDENLRKYWGILKRWQNILGKDEKWAKNWLTQEFGSEGNKRLEEIKNARKSA